MKQFDLYTILLNIVLDPIMKCEEHQFNVAKAFLWHISTFIYDKGNFEKNVRFYENKNHYILLLHHLYFPNLYDYHIKYQNQPNLST